MTEDWSKSEDFLKYADHCMEKLLPMMQESAVCVSLVPDGPSDVKFAVELGFSIMLDKPIIAVVPAGAKVPAKLIKIADAIVEGDFTDPAFGKRLNEEMARVLRAANE